MICENCLQTGKMANLGVVVKSATLNCIHVWLNDRISSRRWGRDMVWNFGCLMKLPRKSSCLLLPCPSASGPAYFWPQALPTFTQPYRGKLQASPPECKGLSLPSGSLSRDAHKWAQFQAWRGCCRRLGPWLVRGWWQTLPQRNVFLQMPLVGFLTHPLPYSRSLQ